jgi:hypothetical protein
MNNVRCGERATFAGLFVLSAGAICVALTACSSGSDTGGSLGGWGGTAGSNGNGNGASGPTDPTGGNAGSGGGTGTGGGTTVNVDASAPGADAGTRHTTDGGGDAVVDAAPVEDTGSSANTLSLVNTNVNTIVYGETIYGYDPIANNSVLDVSKVGDALSIRANPMPQIVDHIDFVMDGTYTHTERAAPYFLCGDNGNGTITNCIQYFTNGAHMLTITVYALGSADAGPDGGPPLDSTTLYFSVTSSEAGAPDAGGGG